VRRGIVQSTAFNFAEIAMEKAKELEPGTREFVFEGVQRWYDAALGSDLRPTNIFVLLAGAGVGKSCIMVELSRRGNSALANSLGGDAHTTSPSLARFTSFVLSSAMHKSLNVALRSIATQLRAPVPGFGYGAPRARSWIGCWTWM
jgi:hypothetical protein